MRFLRAVERHHWIHARKLASAYPQLSRFVDIHGSALHIDAGLQLVREHARELSRTSLLEEMEDFHQNQTGMPDAQAAARRQSIMTKLLRLKPGAALGLHAIGKSAREVVTEPEQIAKALCDHWRKTFTHQPIDQEALSHWLRATLPRGGLGKDGRSIHETAPEA